MSTNPASSSARSRHIPAGARYTLYEEPRLYDIGFGYRDIPAECNGLLALARRHGLQRVRSVGDVACGPAHHLREFARRGCRAYGVDLNRRMLAYAKRLCRSEAVDVDFRRADMRSFELPERVDLMLYLLDAFSHCINANDAVASLAAAAANLRRGGLVVIELPHPADFFDRTDARVESTWKESCDGVAVRTRYEIARIDPVDETYVADVIVEVTERDRRTQRLVERQHKGMWLRSGIVSAVSASGCFDVAGWYGDLSPKVPLSMRPSAWRMVPVLRRR